MRGLKVAKPSTRGFALVLVMLLLSAVGVFLSGLAYSKLLDKRLVKLRHHHEKAKDIALFALDLALAHLEDSLGPMQRTSTVPCLESTHPEAYWTGVWEREAAGTTTFRGYLVPLQEPAGETSFLQGTTAVRVPTIQLPGDAGFYSYWISDEGVKAKVNLGTDIKAQDERDRAQLGPIAYTKPMHLKGFESIDPRALSSIKDEYSAVPGLGLSPSALMDNWHHVSWRSYGLLLNSLNPTDQGLITFKQNLNSLNARGTLSPEEELIQSFQALSQNIQPSPQATIHPRPFYVAKDNPYAPATLKAMGVGPLCTRCQLAFDIEHPKVDTLAVYQSIVLCLWNPYAMGLASHTYTIQILCNKKPVLGIRSASASGAEGLEEKLSEQAIELSTQESSELGYGLSLVQAKLCTAFEPGEHKLFVLKASQDGSGTLFFEEAERLAGKQNPLRLQEVPYVLAHKTEPKPVLKGPKEGLHARRQVRRERTPLPQQRQARDASEPKPLAIPRQALGKNHEALLWPNTLIRLSSDSIDYGEGYAFQELYLCTQRLEPLLMPDSIPSTVHLALEYTLCYKADKPFQNNVRAFIPPQFEARDDAAWQWLWQNSQTDSLRSLTERPPAALALFDLGPLENATQVAHSLLSLDPNSPLYTPIGAYHDTTYCDNALTRQTSLGMALEGAFNINSRSAIAWESLLRSSYAPDLRPCGSFSRCLSHTPKHNLSAQELQTLAQAIAELVKARPPLLSLAECIEMDLFGQALEKLNLPYAEHPLLKLSSLDLLQTIGPILSPRSDTFRIRAQGEYCIGKDAQGNDLRTQASCEALVQRYAEESNAGAKHTRFKVLNLRWVDADKL